jgi:hypothetical protein
LITPAALATSINSATARMQLLNFAMFHPVIASNPRLLGVTASQCIATICPRCSQGIMYRDEKTVCDRKKKI